MWACKITAQAARVIRQPLVWPRVYAKLACQQADLKQAPRRALMAVLLITA